jgi:predicted  nucleic acid-binding Zn-ribbon protein
MGNGSDGSMRRNLSDNSLSAKQTSESRGLSKDTSFKLSGYQSDTHGNALEKTIQEQAKIIQEQAKEIQALKDQLKEVTQKDRSLDSPKDRSSIFEIDSIQSVGSENQSGEVAQKDEVQEKDSGNLRRIVSVRNIRETRAIRTIRELEKSQKENERLTKDLADRKAENEGLNEKVNELQQKLAEGSKKSQGLEQQLDEKDRKIQALEQELDKGKYKEEALTQSLKKENNINRKLMNLAGEEMYQRFMESIKKDKKLELPGKIFETNLPGLASKVELQVSMVLEEHKLKKDKSKK